MKMIKALGLTLATAGMMTFAAQAVPITGGISFSGTYAPDTGNLNTADAFTAFNNVLVNGTSGSFAAAGVTLNTAGSVTMNPFSFDPFPAAGLLLWSTAEASFYLDAPISLSRLNNTLQLTGLGTLSLNGYDNTPGEWVITANQSPDRSTFSFSMSNGAIGVPDGASTLFLLGSALLGLFGIARKPRQSV